MLPNTQETANLVTFTEEVWMENFIFFVQWYTIISTLSIERNFSYEEEP